MPETPQTLDEVLKPEGFTPDPSRLAEAVAYLESRAIPAGLAAARGVKLITPARAEQLAAAFPMSAATILAGTLFEAPLHAPDGTQHDLPQLRRVAADVPGWVGGKFAMPRGMATGATVNPLSPSLDDTDVAFVIVEGLAKADAVQAVDPTRIVLAYTGVDMPAISRGDAIGPRPGDLLAENPGVFRGRSVDIAFDGDSAVKKTVAQATDKVAALYAAAGADVTITTIPTTEANPGAGPDDFLAAAGPFAAAGIWSSRPRSSLAEWRQAGLKRGLLDQARPRVVRPAQWLPAHMKGWNASTIAKVAFSVPVTVDGDAIYGADRKRLGSIAYDENGRPGVATKEARPPEIRPALRRSARRFKFFFESVVPAALLDQLAPSTNSNDFDTLVDWLDGTSTPELPEHASPLGARALDDGTEEITLLQEGGDTEIYRPGSGIILEREKVDLRSSDAERVRVQETVTTWAAWARAISEPVTISPQGEVRPVAADAGAEELVDVEVGGQIYHLPTPIRIGRGSSAPDISSIVTAAKALRLSDRVVAMRDPNPARKAAFERAYGVLSSGAAVHQISDRIEMTNRGLVTPLGVLTADGSFDSTLQAAPDKPNGRAIGPALAHVTPGAQIPTAAFRSWVERCFPGNPAIGYALIAIAVAAPFTSRCSLIPTLWIFGDPGSAKSLAAKAAMRFMYGVEVDHSATGLALLDPTPAGVRWAMSDQGPLMILLDDLRPGDSGNAVDWAKKLKLMAEVTGIRFDSQERAQAHGQKSITSWPVVSAEVKISEGSRIQRVLFLEAIKGQMNVPELKKFETVAPAYWGWLASFAGREPSELRDIFEAHRTEYLQGRTDRTDQAVGAIAAGLTLAGLADVIPMVDAAIRAQHDDARADAEPSQRFLDSIAGLLDSGQAHVTLRGLHLTGAEYLRADVDQLHALGWREEMRGDGGSLVPRGRDELGSLSADRTHLLVPVSTMIGLVARFAGFVDRGNYDKDRTRQILASVVAPGSLTKSGYIPTEYLVDGAKGKRGFVIPLAALGIAAPRAIPRSEWNVTPITNPAFDPGQPVQFAATPSAQPMRAS